MTGTTSSWQDKSRNLDASLVVPTLPVRTKFDFARHFMRWMSSQVSTFLSALGTAIAATMLAMFANGIAAAQTGADATRDPMAGHRAELDQALSEKDPLRRLFFFDPVDAEGPSPGVPCNHIAARRPEQTAGEGWVAVFETRGAPVRRFRFWVPPAAGLDAEAVAAAGRAFAATHAGEAEIVLIGVRRFVWCR